MSTPGNCLLTVLTPVDYVRGGPQDRLTRLEWVLDQMQTAQPYEHRDTRRSLLFGETPMVHMARFLIIDEIPVQMGVDNSGQLASKYLLFIAELDGGRDSFLDRLYQTRSDDVDAIWGNCIGYPDNCDAHRFARYIREHEVETTLPYCAYAGTSMRTIRNQLEVQRQLTDFITDHQNTEDPQSLRRAWRSFLGKLDELDLSEGERRRWLP